MTPRILFLGLTFAFGVALQAETNPPPALPPLTIDGQNFVDPDGNVVKFWGVNLTALYPDRAAATATAQNLAERQINLVRPHHMLRQSKDWNPQMVSGALVDYRNDSRTWDKEALDRFDFLNAELARQGIYLAFSVHFSRQYHPGDVTILETDAADAAAWSAAISELEGWPWKKAIDVRKALPAIDERAALLNEEFIENLLTHVNPYTGRSYAEDPQLLIMEVVNESSLEYAVICKNRFPEHWDKQLQASWEAYARANGLDKPGDLYAPVGLKAIELRAKFLRKLDTDYYNRIRAKIESLGCEVPMMYSNLWRGDNALAMQAELSDVTENHAYIDPLVVRDLDDGFNRAAKNSLQGKPYFIGEFNQAEGSANIKEHAPYRTMLMVAAPAYANLHDWSGIVWFSWNHGTDIIEADGWTSEEGRNPRLGTMVADAMMTDHLRTAGMLFRNGWVSPSAQPITVWVEEPYFAGNYDRLMEGKHKVLPGWQSVHGIRRAYGKEPDEQFDAEWLYNWPGKVMVSDTNEIIKDTVRRQLTLAVPQGEAFSGFLDGELPAGLSHLEIDDDSGFATVIVVAEDDKPLAQSTSLVISRTYLDDDLKEQIGPAVTLNGLAALPEGKQWAFAVTRPRSAEPSAPVMLTPGADGSLMLPDTLWYEAELHPAE
ncbi:hypothetical protein H5P28_15060 [Ruficoccus amylovorans]|uniref:Glycoside hydrolase family 5 domain-containing protein n=1 Tax=Ruficoccus amylovorans TaxID=1804625 RepID=A0A842HFY7_9BACT|nr:hypothetical protein [Ruficoccus amylovorans]MBC2595585.1 hypothetical protein [Ruficoccus amylovorans]